ncbi:MAG: response regulator [Acidobacteria bacterium]|nr:response regulator [Acidobacteriota bacterium]
MMRPLSAGLDQTVPAPDQPGQTPPEASCRGESLAALGRVVEPLPGSPVVERPVFPRVRATGVVLLVEDDAVTRLAFQRILEKQGYCVRTASNGAETNERLRHAEEIDAAILDYVLPDTNGIEILDALRLRDPRVAASLVTALGEKEIIARALTNGACGFLEKPVRGAELAREVRKLVSTTRRNRRLAHMVEEVHQMSLILSAHQKARLEAPLAAWPLEVRAVHHPLYEVGGDYLLQHRLGEGEWLLISVDISGHDLSAACTLAYFQGIASGILPQGGTPEQLVRAFHAALLEQHSLMDSPGGMVSAALCCLVFRQGQVEVACFGAPQPVLSLPDKLARRVGCSQAPLGWFEQLEWNPQIHEFPPGATVKLWTDGLEDLAAYHGIDTLALAHTLLLPAAQSGASGLEDAADDVMLVAVSHRGEQAVEAPGWEYVLKQRYRDKHLKEIDALQQFWQRSLLWALPAVSSERLHDILLCCREAVINSLLHGCGRDEHVHLEAMYSARAGRLRVQVKDCGKGHQADWRAALEDSGDGLREFSRGLLLIHALPAEVSVIGEGAHLIMDFELR